MKKEEWYRNRIEWRASQHKLQECSWEHFKSENDEQARRVANLLVSCGAPVLIFWCNGSLWTVLTDTAIVGCNNSGINSVNLDDIQKRVAVVVTEEMDAKISADYLLAGNNRVPFWVSSGKHLFALMNILRMFPLNVPA